MVSSNFADMAASARDAHADIFGQTSEAAVVTIAVGSAEPESISAVIHRQRTVTRKVSGDTIRVTVRDVRFPSLTSIDHTAIIMIGDVKWTVDEVRELQASGLIVQLLKQELHRRSRNGYRGESAANSVSSNAKG